MKKAVKRIRKTLTGILVGIVFLALLAGGLANMPFVQNAVARKIAGIASEYMGCEVSISRAELTLFKKSLRLYDFQIKDNHGNVTVYAREGFAVLRTFNSKTVALRSALLVDPGIYITRYEGDSMSDFKRVIKKIASRPKKDTALRKSFEMDVWRIENATFYYDDAYTEPKSNGTVDFKHIRLREGYARGKNFYTKCGVVRADIRHLRAKEGSGVEVEDFSTQITVEKGKLHFCNSTLETPRSRAELTLHLLAENWPEYKDFTRNVEIRAEVEPSEIAAEDLRFFVPSVGKMYAKIFLSGSVSGPVSDLDMHKLKAGYGTATSVNADIRLTGLPDTLLLNADIRNVKISRRDVESLRLPDGTKIVLPPSLDALQKASLSGTFQGGFEKFRANLFLETDLGNIRITNHAVDTLSGPAVMVGNIEARDVRLDKILKKDSLLGSADLNMAFYLSGRDFDRMTCRLEGEIPNLYVDGTPLTPVSFDAQLQKNYVRARVECRDPNLDFTLYGSLDIRSACSESKYNLHLRNLELRPLHLMGDSGSFRVGARVSVVHSGLHIDSIKGGIVVNNVRLHRLGRDYTLSDMEVRLTDNGPSNRRASVRSPLLDFNLQGNWGFKSMAQEIRRLPAHHFPVLFDSVCISSSSPQIAFKGSLNIKNADSLLVLFIPKVHLPVGLSAKLDCGKGGEKLKFSVDMPYVQYGKIAWIRGGLSFDADSDKAAVRAKAESLYLDEDIKVSDFVLDCGAVQRDSLRYRLHWHSPDSTGTGNSEIAGSLAFYEGGRFKADFQNYRLLLGKNWWKGYPDGYVFYGGDSLVFHRVGLESENTDGGIHIDGELSHKPNSLLRAEFEDFSMKHLHFFLRKVPMEVAGQINGYAQVRDFYESFAFDADLQLDNLRLNNYTYGTGTLLSRFSRKDAVNAEFRLVESRDGGPVETLSLKGVCYPLENNRLDFTGKVRDFPTAFLDEILHSVLYDMRGGLDGTLRIGGRLSSPDLFADLHSGNLEATVPFLNTRYRFTDFGLRLTSNEITFTDCRFQDRLMNPAGVLKGGLRHRNFKNIRLDMSIDFNNLLALDTKRTADMPFWGSVYGTGNLLIRGPIDNIKVLLNAKVEDKSDIHFNFSGSGGAAGEKYIRFSEKKPREKDTALMTLESFYTRIQQKVRRRNNLSMDLNLDITPGLGVFLGLKNSAMDGKLKATGSGMLRVLMNESGPQLFGTYTIDGGEFDFSMLDILNKRFVLENGGTISWVGPMADARINVRADYQTKASLYPVLSSFNPTDDEARQMKQNANVNSIIILSGNLSNPDIGFDIDLVNTDEETKDKFFAVVRKDDEDEMLRQTFSLLMFNSFLAVNSSSSGIANAALSSSSDFLFSQFNNFLSQFTDKFNVGLNYRPHDDTRNEEFQVMMSSQLFNDRLVINGNLGVTEQNAGVSGGSSTGSRASTFVGEVDVEWKFTEELRLKGFNHSNDQDLTKPVNTYTQGVGVVFKRDFDNWQEFIHGRRQPKTKEERTAMRAQKKAVKQAKKAAK